MTSNSKLAHFEKYLVAPSPSRDYYGIKVFDNEVILYRWRISHGPHLMPTIRISKFTDFNRDKTLRDDINHVFGPNVLNYIKLSISDGTSTLLTLPKDIIKKLITYLSFKDVAKLLCVSSISNEVFNSNAVWEILFKRVKDSSELTDMEKNLSASQGFKKMAKEQHTRTTIKKSLKSMDDKSSRTQKSTVKIDKIARSASVTMPKSASPPSTKLTGRKHVVDDTQRKSQKSSKSSVKGAVSSANAREKETKFDLPKKSTSEERSSIFVDGERCIENHGERCIEKRGAAGEGYSRTISASMVDGLGITKSSTGSTVRKSSEKRQPQKQVGKLSKFKFVNEVGESAELLMQKEYMRAAIARPDFGDIGSDEMLKNTPRSLYPKQPSSLGLNDLKQRTSDKTMPSSQRGHPRKSKRSKAAPTKGPSLDLKNLVQVDGKADDSDCSGMSYLMKRYLEASDDVARKFTECERIARATRNSGIQVDMNEKAERKPLRKAHKVQERPTSRNVSESPANMLNKLRTFKKV